MARDATVRARVDSKLKEDAEKIFSEIGLTTSQAITLFLNRVRIERGIPFALKTEYKEFLDEIQTGKGA